MTIEIAAPSTAAKVTATNDASGVKSKASVPGKSPPSGSTGFMEILTSIDGAVPLELPTSDAVVPSESLPILLDPSANANPDACSLLAQAVQWMVPIVDAPVEPDASQAIASAPVSDQAITGLLTPNVDLGALQPVLLPVSIPSATIGQRSEGVKRGVSGIGGESTRKDVLADSFPRPLQKGSEGPSDTAMLQTLSVVDASLSMASGMPSDSRVVKVPDNELAAKMALTQVESASPVASNSAKRDEQSVMRAVFKPGPAAETLVHSSASSWTGGTIGMATMSGAVATPQSNPLTDAYVAEQVSYWISNDVQNAELKLDGISDRPVEVSISLNGNEAHITFRTDELRARDALENASQHLKEMLLREGLVLSGVSVGTSGGGSSDTQDRNLRQGGRQSTSIIEKSVSKEVPSIVGRQAVGRALDLFV